MRVTQFMLADSNLKYISQSYNSLSKIQDQLNTGKKITRPSDDPVIAMKGMRYRTQLVEVNQFNRNLTEGLNWLDNSDSALNETNQVLQRIRDLIVEASNDTYDEVSRNNIAKEISSLQEHIVSIANTKVGDNYIFNGTDTAKQPINDSLFNVDLQSDVSKDLGEGKSGNYVISYKGQLYEFIGTIDNDGNLSEGNDNKDNNIKVFAILPKTTYSKVDPDPNKSDKDRIIEGEGYSASIKIEFDSTDKTKIKSISYTSLEEKEVEEGKKAMIEVTKSIYDSSENIDETKNLVFSRKDAVSTNSNKVEIEVMKGVHIPININSKEVFSIKMFSGLESIKKMLQDPNTTGDEITKSLDYIDDYLNDVVSTRAEIGAQTNRAELIENRLLEQKTVAEKTISDNEDIDFEEVIINLTIQQTLHRAALAAGAKIIQPTLMDFLS